mmetsp:Transcript_16237/g.41439  ORF Transcript_16237/g.41439 Transcript_16237/m.41439 type:complete len:286 (+) Transcript_16237:3256-4113(+)
MRGVKIIEHDSAGHGVDSQRPVAVQHGEDHTLHQNHVEGGQNLHRSVVAHAHGPGVRSVGREASDCHVGETLASVTGVDVREGELAHAELDVGCVSSLPGRDQDPVHPARPRQQHCRLRRIQGNVLVAQHPPLVRCSRVRVSPGCVVATEIRNVIITVVDQEVAIVRGISVASVGKCYGAGSEEGVRSIALEVPGDALGGGVPVADDSEAVVHGEDDVLVLGFGPGELEDGLRGGHSNLASRVIYGRTSRTRSCHRQPRKRRTPANRGIVVQGSSDCKIKQPEVR